MDTSKRNGRTTQRKGNSVKAYLYGRHVADRVTVIDLREAMGINHGKGCPAAGTGPMTDCHCL